MVVQNRKKTGSKQPESNSQRAATGQEKPRPLMNYILFFIIIVAMCYFYYIQAEESERASKSKIKFVKDKTKTNKKEQQTSISFCSHVSGYVPEYRLDDVMVNIDHYSISDEIILFSVALSPTGSLSFSPDSPGLEKDKLKSVKIMKESGVKSVLLSIGGGGRSQGFQHVASSTERRKKLGDELLELCLLYDLNGIDFDWEGPANQSEINDYSLLLQDVKKVFAPHNKVVTVAVHYFSQLTKIGAKSVDKIHMMAYDLNKRHSTLSDSRMATNQFLSKIPNLYWNKIVLGIPAYGRAIQNPGDVLTYRDIVAHHQPKPVLDEVPTKNGDVMYFNGKQTVKQKINYCQKEKMLGIFFWELGQDSTDPEFSLLTAAKFETHRS